MFAARQGFLGEGTFGRVASVRKREGVLAGTLFAIKYIGKQLLATRGYVRRVLDEKKVQYSSRAYQKISTTVVLLLCPGGKKDDKNKKKSHMTHDTYL